MVTQVNIDPLRQLDELRLGGHAAHGAHAVTQVPAGDVAIFVRVKFPDGLPELFNLLWLQRPVRLPVRAALAQKEEGWAQQVVCDRAGLGQHRGAWEARRWLPAPLHSSAPLCS